MNLKTCAEGTKLRVYKSVVPNKANSHHFKNMIVGAQQVGNYYNFQSCIHFNNIIIIYKVWFQKIFLYALIIYGW